MEAKRPEYALANPLCLLLNKAPRDFRRRDLLKVIEQKKIERITFHYTALDGKPKELKIPVADRLQAETILAEGERVDGSSLFKGMVDMAVSDLYVVPLYRTAFLNPFDQGSLDFVCRYLNKDGEPAPFALDNILARACGLLRRTSGLELHTLGELEFYLLSPNDDCTYVPSKQKGYHNAAPFGKSGEILDEMLRHITQITGAVKYAHCEVGYVDCVRSENPELAGRRAEQLEVEYLPRPADEMADDLVLGRWIIRNTAHKHGAVATFTPKIEEGMAGSGLHIHTELRKAGTNIMCGRDGKLSEQARRLIGGLCRYADSLTAFGNTVSSAYLRLVPHQEAPTRICWSDQNRSAMIRVPLGWSNVHNLAGRVNPPDPSPLPKASGRQTVELRSPDGSALIHLLMAGMVMAAEWGFRKDSGGAPLELAEQLYVKGNIFEDKELLNRLPTLPSSCVASSRLLLQKREIYEREGIFPPSVIDYMAELLASENDESMNRKVDDLPEDRRLQDMHRIMHKDIHRH